MFVFTIKFTLNFFRSPFCSVLLSAMLSALVLKPLSFLPDSGHKKSRESLDKNIYLKSSTIPVETFSLNLTS